MHGHGIEDSCCQEPITGSGSRWCAWGTPGASESVAPRGLWARPSKPHTGPCRAGAWARSTVSNLYSNIRPWRLSDYARSTTAVNACAIGCDCHSLARCRRHTPDVSVAQRGTRVPVAISRPPTLIGPDAGRSCTCDRGGPSRPLGSCAPYQHRRTPFVVQLSRPLPRCLYGDGAVQGCSTDSSDRPAESTYAAEPIRQLSLASLTLSTYVNDLGPCNRDSPSSLADEVARTNGKMRVDTIVPCLAFSSSVSKTPGSRLLFSTRVLSLEKLTFDKLFCEICDRNLVLSVGT